MTTIHVEVQDERKAEDVFRFLKDINFLNVHIERRSVEHRRKPAMGLAGTRINGDIMSPVVGRVPHPDLKHSIEVCGDLMNTVPAAGWDLPQ